MKRYVIECRFGKRRYYAKISIRNTQRADFGARYRYDVILYLDKHLRAMVGK